VESMVAMVLADHLLRQQFTRGVSGLAALRRGIDLLDDALVILLNQRQAMVADLGKLKKRSGAIIADPKREKSILDARLALLDETILDEKLIRTVYGGIFRHSRGIQKR